MNTNDFVNALERELRLAGRRRVRLALARLPRPPAGAVGFALALVVCAAVAAPLLAIHSGATSAPQPQTRPTGSSRVIVGCRHTVSGALSRDWRSSRAGTIVAGPIAWVYLRQAANTVALKRGHFVKALAVVNPGQDVTVTVPRRERARLSLDYTSIAPRSRFRLSDGSSSVTFKPCPNPPQLDVAGGLSQFAGGFIVSGPQCAEVDVQAQGAATPVRRYIALGRPCPAGAATATLPVRNALAGNGIGQATFGEDVTTVTRRLTTLLGAPPSKPYYRIDLCGIDHAIGWSGLIVYFRRGRFVGYSDQSVRLATRRGLKVGDVLLRGRSLYGTAFGVGPVQGGVWVAKTRQGRIDGFTTDVTNLHGRVMTIEAGYVGCPAMSP